MSSMFLFKESSGCADMRTGVGMYVLCQTVMERKIHVGTYIITEENEME